MKKNGPIAVLTAMIFFSVAIAFAQVGQKDGVNVSPTDLERVKVGDQAPELTLEDIGGRQISLDDFRGKKHVVLVFYRGHW